MDAKSCCCCCCGCSWCCCYRRSNTVAVVVTGLLLLLLLLLATTTNAAVSACPLKLPTLPQQGYTHIAAAHSLSVLSSHLLLQSPKSRLKSKYFDTFPLNIRFFRSSFECVTPLFCVSQDVCVWFFFFHALSSSLLASNFYSLLPGGILLQGMGLSTQAKVGLVKT